MLWINLLFFCSKFVFTEKISKVWIGLEKLNEQEENIHLNNLLESTSTNTANGWTIDCEHGVWDQGTRETFGDLCSNWYCYSHPAIPSVSTTFKGIGRAKLDFGNCHNVGKVHVSLDGTEIATAPKNTLSKTVEIDFNDGSILKVS